MFPRALQSVKRLLTLLWKRKKREEGECQYFVQPRLTQNTNIEVSIAPKNDLDMLVRKIHKERDIGKAIGSYSNFLGWQF